MMKLSPARVRQIMALRWLAPTIQERLLDPEGDLARIGERKLLTSETDVDWFQLVSTGSNSTTSIYQRIFTMLYFQV